MRPLWRQVPEVLVRYTSETLGLSKFRLRGLFGSQPLAQTLSKFIDWDALHRNVEDGVIESAAVTATSVRTGRVIVFTESGSRRAALGARVPRALRRHPARRPPPDGLRGDPGSVPLRACRRARRGRGVVRRRRHPPPSATRSGSRAGCRSRGRGRHRWTAPARRRPRPGPARRRPRRRRGYPARRGHGRPAATRPAAARGAQRADGGRRARPCSRPSPRGARPVAVPHGPLRRGRAPRRRGARPHCDGGLPRQPRLATSHPRRPRPADHAPVARQRQPAAGRASLVPLVRPRLLRGRRRVRAPRRPAWRSTTPTCGGSVRATTTPEKAGNTGLTTECGAARGGLDLHEVPVTTRAAGAAARRLGSPGRGRPPRRRTATTRCRSPRSSGARPAPTTSAATSARGVPPRATAGSGTCSPRGAIRRRWSCVRLGEVYFVVDGHHRLAVARERGWLSIPARVRHVCTVAYARCCLRLAHLDSLAAQRRFLQEIPLPDDVRESLLARPPRRLVAAHRRRAGVVRTGGRRATAPPS